MKEGKQMPAKGQFNPDARDEKGRYKSMSYAAQKESNAEYDKTMDKIVIRVPKGSKSKIEEYVRNKAAEDPDNPRYSTDKGRPSVNALIKDLLENEIGNIF